MVIVESERALLTSFDIVYQLYEYSSVADTVNTDVILVYHFRLHFIKVISPYLFALLSLSKTSLFFE